MNILFSKFKEVTLAVLPITIIVLILNFTIAPIEPLLIWRFIIGAIFIIIGLGIFLFGADIGIQPIGSLMGSYITKSKKIWVMVVFGLILGFLITIAEPDLQILATSISGVTSGAISKFSILLVVSTGVGILLVVGLLRVVLNVTLAKLLTILYGIIFLLALLSSSGFLAISFDAAGATTGAMTVPFILALGLGVSSIKGGVQSEEDSFGLVAIASTGPIISVLIMSIVSKVGISTGNLAYDSTVSEGIISPFVHHIPITMMEVAIALAPITIIFGVFQALFFKLPNKKMKKILKGLVYTFLGLVLFLTGVNAGFMEAGSATGYAVGALEHNWILIPIGFILGFTVIFAEPAVYVLNEQIETVTSGHIKKKIILYTLSIGVAFAVALSMIRIMIPWIQLWMYLLPGYLISIVMSYHVPKIFVGIAFDSGGVASGPMTATFILAFAQGAAEAIEGANVLIDAFGIIAMVAMTPLIAIQILGLLYKRKAAKEGVEISES
ncbi:hypothetical protein J2Z44_001166 [Clostridium punense]|uniref:DUF1538 domain-containing protein n=1 Tax=Clostridium punense TaxID=1054297 RepID=A0ABS4K0S0_9CLOT|nr:MULTISPECIES: DUF1538 domain-containing protein [Clostridium]EQB89932.1 hypothetical protein M918_18115 [Clostridium sp. BL8]MBP2021370.1 hypothetical protein [Clostridium punense]